MTSRAPSAGLMVVAAKVPERCIIRAFSIGFNQSVNEMIEHVLRYVGCMNPAVEWTGYTYEGRPFYWHQLAGVSPYGGGVYRWDYTGHDTYRGPPVLLHRPRGWVEIRDPAS